MALGPYPPVKLTLSTERERKIAARVIETCMARGMSYNASCAVARVLARS